MRTAFRSGNLGLIQHLFIEGTCTGLSDARLLERFVTRGDEAAFAALVSRHGALVLNTCQAVLKDPDAAADAFQATFVRLFRKAGSIRAHEALGAWLHRVAYRTALQARSEAARRREIERTAGILRAAESRDHDDRGAVLHEEIERLPERFRRPVVLCYLEGMTRDQAADSLRCTEGTVRGRLAKGRELLRHRLGRRGITLAVPYVSRAVVPESLVATTLHTAAGAASGSIAAIVASASRGWLLTRWNVVAVVALTLGAATTAIVYRSPAAGRPAGDNGLIRPIIAAAPPPGRAIAAPSSDEPSTRPVEGRIVDLEGRPVVGVTVSVQFVQSPPDGKLNAWIDEVKRLAKQPFGLPMMATPGRQLPSSATTARDGRFRIDGLPRDAILTASITGPGIETSQVYILTREMPAIRVKDPMVAAGPMIVYYGARFDHVAAPARAIVGTVRDKDTGAPIPGVKITGMPNIPNSLVTTPGIGATTDKQGRFRVDGLPVARGFKLFTEAPNGLPYVNGGFVCPGGEPGPGPFTFDIALKRGLLVRGRLTNKATGRPLHGSLKYLAFRDNPHLDEYPNFKRNSQETQVIIPDDDGLFVIPALPGRGLIAARATEDGYLHGVGAAAIKGIEKETGAFATYPYYCMTSDQHVFAEINPAPGTKELTLFLQVDPGRTVKGTIVDPDGSPIAGGVEIRTLDVFQGPQQTPMNSPAFVVNGLPTGPYRLDFFLRGRKLAGSLVLKGDETGDLTLKLQPWGTLVGRVVDEGGKPRSDVEFFSTIRERPDPERGDLESKPTVDAQGRFRIGGLVPGVKYDAYGHASNKAGGPLLKGVQVGPGEVKDLGDLILPTAKKDGD